MAAVCEHCHIVSGAPLHFSSTTEFPTATHAWLLGALSITSYTQQCHGMCCFPLAACAHANSLLEREKGFSQGTATGVTRHTEHRKRSCSFSQCHGSSASCVGACSGGSTGQAFVCTSLRSPFVFQPTVHPGSCGVVSSASPLHVIPCHSSPIAVIRECRYSSRTRLVCAKVTLCVQVREAAPLLAQLKMPGPLDLHNAAKENVKLRVVRELQKGALSANSGTMAAIGSVLMQLLMMQLNARSLHPLFRQPIPWHFVNPAPAGAPSNCVAHVSSFQNSS